jgi:hypothetical protein
MTIRPYFLRLVLRFALCATLTPRRSPVSGIPHGRMNYEWLNSGRFGGSQPSKVPSYVPALPVHMHSPKGRACPPRLVSLWETKSLRDRNIPMVWNVAPGRGIISFSPDCARNFPQEIQKSGPVPLATAGTLVHAVALRYSAICSMSASRFSYGKPLSAST